VASLPPPAAAPVPPARRVTQFRHDFAPPQPGAPAAILLVESGSLAGTRFPLGHEPFRIGAEEGNDLTIAEDAYLSSRHARLYFQEGSLFIHDQESTNGTFVNGERLGDTPRPLGPGDRIRVGHTELVVLAP
jgi:pSer/pThr/pTyr-binding forkhead associated (FHA) protein